ncbi:hypothetical protein B7R74_20135 [Yersinia pseudotuberculosis]|nr:MULTISPECIES: ROK family protein [Yersinia pseudotuberculosis complex]PSH12619.1 hypothetical protein B7R74_20135 [Yersinia pseudotuberculosis]
MFIDIPFSSLFSSSWMESNDKMRIFTAVLNGQASSRRDLAQLLSIRSTSVSVLVGELLELRLLTETSASHSGRGRPLLTLVANPHRLAALVCQVSSQSLHVININLAGQVLCHEQIQAPGDCDNQTLAELLNQLVERVIQRTPQTTEIVGVCFSLPGLVDIHEVKWVFAARWPRMKNMKLANLFPQLDCPVFISRTMDAELYARFAHSQDSTLLLHWGYGVGTAFISAGRLASGGSSFGEIGHWHLPDHHASCYCGRQGCLETISALWALGPLLLGDNFSVGDDEDRVASRLQQIDLLAIPEIQTALKHLTVSLANLCRIFFPSRVVVSGPFTANSALWAAFCELLAQENHFVDLPHPELLADRRSREFETLGAASPALEKAFMRLFCV